MAVREHHGKDESHHSCVPPEAVLFPTDVKQVQEIARLIHLCMPACVLVGCEVVLKVHVSQPGSVLITPALKGYL